MFHVGIAGSMSEALIILAIYRVPVSVSGCFQALMSVGSVAIVSPMSASITADLFESIMINFLQELVSIRDFAVQHGGHCCTTHQ